MFMNFFLLSTLNFKTVSKYLSMLQFIRLITYSNEMQQI